MQIIVTTRQGAVEGVRSADSKTVIFKGVPYAKAPVGALRFKRPQPREPWEGVLDCTKFSPICPQADLRGMPLYGKEFYDGEEVVMNEDCLYLNIWTPAEAEADSKLPVMVWIHGGAFMHGHGSEKEFDGEGFAKKGVILVTINYRVNVFGFFAHPDLESETAEGVSGNYGILDQLAALNWVKENIAAFGGDGEKITLAGQSAGCMSVQSIVSSPLSKGLLRGAVFQSGVSFHAFHATPGKETLHTLSKKLMEHLNVSTIEELRQIPAQALKDAAYAVSGQGIGWCPHVDGWMLPQSCDDAAESGNTLDIPYMLGCTSGDIGGGDMLVKSSAGWCENQLKLGRAPSYFYFFHRALPGDNAGAFHSSELWYEFETLPRCWRPWEPCDFELSRIMSSYWANFAKTGDPNGEGLPLWKPYTAEHPGKIMLGETVEMN